jgi:hypothetical protein
VRSTWERKGCGGPQSIIVRAQRKGALPQRQRRHFAAKRFATLSWSRSERDRATPQDSCASLAHSNDGIVAISLNGRRAAVLLAPPSVTRTLDIVALDHSRGPINAANTNPCGTDDSSLAVNVVVFAATLHAPVADLELDSVVVTNILGILAIEDEMMAARYRPN